MDAERIDKARRVHIVGGAGSGKTTLARLLSERLHVPAYDLDAIGYEGGAGPKRPLEVRLRDVCCIATQPGWVTEGIFLWWTDELLRKADLVIWLDLPFRIAAWRILLRHVKAELARSNRHPGWRSLIYFLRSVRRYYASGPVSPRAPDDDAAVTRKATALVLEPYRSKLVVCRSRADVRGLVRSLCKQ